MQPIHIREYHPGTLCSGKPLVANKVVHPPASSKTCNHEAPSQSLSVAQTAVATTKEKLAVSSCRQEVKDTATNPGNFQNKTPCADHFEWMNEMNDPVTPNAEAPCSKHIQQMAQNEWMKWMNNEMFF